MTSSALPITAEELRQIIDPNPAGGVAYHFTRERLDAKVSAILSLLSSRIGEPVGYLVEWTGGDGEPRYRVDSLTWQVEPWLAALKPKRTPLYALANPDGVGGGEGS